MIATTSWTPVDLEKKHGVRIELLIIIASDFSSVASTECEKLFEIILESLIQNRRKTIFENSIC